MKVLVTVPRQPHAHHYPSPLKVVALEVSGDDTVASVKATLHDMEGIPPRRQRLVFARSALPDDDDTTLGEHGVTDSSAIQLVETGMQVFVRCFHDGTGRTITLSDIESSHTVESFRIRLQELKNIPLRPAQQRIVCGGSQLEDGHTLAEYGVRDNTNMELIFRPARWRHREVLLDIVVTDTVGRIKERVEEAEGVPVACQSVYYGGKELHDGRALTHDDGGGVLHWVKIVCRRQEELDAAIRRTNQGHTAPMVVVETETGKRRADVKVTGPGPGPAKMEAVERRCFRVYLIGPELGAICPSSCDMDPAG